MTHPPIKQPLGDVTTARLELRRLALDDIDGLEPVFAKPEVWEFPFGRGFSRAQTAEFVTIQMTRWDDCGFGLWLAAERGSGRTIGFVGLSVPHFLPSILPAVEVGWRLDPDVWGLGYATESATAALDEAFTTLGLPEVCSVPQRDNPRSVRVAERLGMRNTGEVPIPANERFGAVTGCLFRITPGEWMARSSADGPPPGQ